jgi:hypothetical protein
MQRRYIAAWGIAINPQKPPMPIDLANCIKQQETVVT